MAIRQTSREDYLKAACEEAAAGNSGLASLLAEEADYAPDTRSDNARVAHDFPGGQRRTEG